MNFLLDENFPKSAEHVLVGAGHRVHDARHLLPPGTADDQLFAKAQLLGAVVLTTDRDFFHTIPHLHDHHHGVLVIALRQPNRGKILEKLTWALQQFKEADFKDRVFHLRDRTWLAFPPLHA